MPLGRCRRSNLLDLVAQKLLGARGCEARDLCLLLLRRGAGESRLRLPRGSLGFGDELRDTQPLGRDLAPRCGHDGRRQTEALRGLKGVRCSWSA